jgi:hypothetical protein
MRLKWMIAAIVIAGSGVARAATLGEVGMRDSLAQAETLERPSVGIAFVQVDRPVELDDATKHNLRAQVYSLQLGADIAPWIMIFGTAGASQARFDEEEQYGNPDFKWSAGLRANWWHFDIADPTFLSGRLSFQATAEFAQYKSRDNIDWNEGYGDLTVHYEMFVDDVTKLEQYPYSLVVYVGPAVSAINGSWADVGFSQENLVGAVGGLDLYLAYNLTLGAQIQYFDTCSYGGSLCYHF